MAELSGMTQIVEKESMTGQKQQHKNWEWGLFTLSHKIFKVFLLKARIMESYKVSNTNFDGQDNWKQKTWTFL